MCQPFSFYYRQQTPFQCTFSNHQLFCLRITCSAHADFFFILTSISLIHVYPLIHSALNVPGKFQQDTTIICFPREEYWQTAIRKLRAPAKCTHHILIPQLLFWSGSIVAMCPKQMHFLTNPNALMLIVNSCCLMRLLNLSLACYTLIFRPTVLLCLSGFWIVLCNSSPHLLSRQISSANRKQLKCSQLLFPIVLNLDSEYLL